MKKVISFFVGFLVLICCINFESIVDVNASSSKMEKAINWAISIANDNSHGYSMVNRWGPDYDCSSFVISALKYAGYDTGNATYTGNMKSNLVTRGFTWIPWSKIGNVNNLQRGDILLNEQQHTEIYLGNGKNVGAHSNRGYPQSGDQTGTEISVSGYYNHPWDGVLRENESSTTERSVNLHVWISNSKMGSVPSSFTYGNGYYLCYELTYADNGQRIDKTGYQVTETIKRPDGSVRYSSSYNNSNNNWIYATCDSIGEFSGTVQVSGSLNGEVKIEYDVGLGNRVDLGSDFTATIKNSAVGKVFTTSTVKQNNNYYVNSSTYNCDETQLWMFSRNSDGTYTITNANNELNLNAKSGQTRDKLITYSSSNTKAEKWSIYSAGNNTYYLKPECSTDCVADLYGLNTAEGAELNIHTFNASDAQKFQINKINPYITFSQNSVNFTLIGQKKNISVLSEPKYSAGMYGNFSSSNSNVVKFSSSSSNTKTFEAVGPGETTITYTIGGYFSRACKITVTPQITSVVLPKYSYSYTGSKIAPEPIVKSGDLVLVKGRDYTVSYSNNTDAGSARVVVNGYGYCTGSKTANFTISKANNFWTTALTCNDITYGNGKVSPYAKSKYGTVSYTYSTSENGIYTSTVPVNPGTYYVKAYVSGTTNYSALTAKKKFTIKPVTATSVALDKTVLTFSGLNNKQHLTATVYPSNATDKTVTWTSSNVNVATVDNNGYVTSVGVGNAVIQARTSDGKVATCKITVTNTITSITLPTYTYMYNGKSITPVPTVKSGNKILEKDIDYTVSYSSNQDSGKATVYVTGKGFYTGKISTQFNICLENTNIKKIMNTAAGISLEWDKVIGATGYYVCRISDGNVIQLAKIDSNSMVRYIDTSAESGEYYSYLIKAYDSGNNTYSSDIEAIERIETPQILCIKNTTSGVKVNWTNIAGATGYIVYRKSGNGKWGRIADITDGLSTSYVDKTAKSGITYTYTVRAYDYNYMSDWNSTKTIKRLNDATVGTVANVTSGVRINWANVAGATGYIVYRKTGSGNWSRIADVKNGTVTSYIDKTAKTGTTYAYTVRAYNGSTIGDWHNSKSIKRLADPKVTGASKTSSGITVKWNQCTGAGGYIIYRKTTSGNWIRIADIKNGAATSYVDRKAAKGVRYTYTVRSYSGKTMSAWSYTKSATR